jgi:glycosyltransferase involved in cell wall biosynthesis
MIAPRAAQSLRGLMEFNESDRAPDEHGRTLVNTPILHVINGEHYAGAERVQHLLSQRLPDFGYDVAFGCVKPGLFSQRHRDDGVRLYDVPMRSRLDVACALRIAALVRRHGFRLIHTHTPRAALVGRLAAARARIPMIHQSHSPCAMDTQDYWRNARNAAVERLSLARVARVIAVSRSLQDGLVRRGLRSERLRTVWNGVPRREQARRSRRAGEPLVVGMVALFRPRKGLEILLRAMAELMGGRSDVRLIAVGPFESESYRADVMRLVRELGLGEMIRWTGFVEDVAGLYRDMHVFALPSLYGEGMPMVVLEAMSVGLPVVSTRVEGVPEAVRDGEEGLIVEPGDVQALAQALSHCARLGEGALAAMGERAWRRQRECFSDVAMARGIADIYREVLAEGGDGA